MEDILEIYKKPYDPRYPVVCMDETTKQLVKEVIPPIPMSFGKPARYDCGYERNGVGDIFMFFEPLRGWRHVEIREHHRTQEWVDCMEILAAQYPEAEKIIVVLDNLRTHRPSAFYEIYPPEKARTLVDRFEFHYTPVHGSWLNMAEIALNMLSRECLDRRIPDISTLKGETAAWERDSNASNKSVNWRFTTEDARIKLKKLYPSFNA